MSQVYAPTHSHAPAFAVRRPALSVVPQPAPAPIPTTATTEPDIVSDGSLRLDVTARTATVDGEQLTLTYLEFELLAHLIAHPRRVFSRRQLMESVWGYPEHGGGRTVDVHVARLRRKVGAGHRRSLVTVHRVGYTYRPATAAA